jgi:hypothetical protein
MRHEESENISQAAGAGTARRAGYIFFTRLAKSLPFLTI